MLKTISGGAFSQKDSIADIYEKVVNAKIELDPVGKEDSDVDNDGDSDSTDKYLLKRRKAIKKAISKQKKENVNKTPEIKLSGKKEVVKISKAVESVELEEKAVSQKQQKFFGIVRAIQKGEASGSPEAEKAAASMSKKDVKDFASTKHKGLPVKKEETEIDENIQQQLAQMHDQERARVKADIDKTEIVKKNSGDSYLVKSIKDDTQYRITRKQDRGSGRWKISKGGKVVTSGFGSLNDARAYIGRVMTKEETEIQEKTDYQLYHKTFSGAMQHAYDMAKKRGYTVDPDEIDNKVATGPRKPSSGKTNKYILGTDKKQNLHVQVANLDNKRYELNMYIESADLDKKTVIRQHDARSKGAEEKAKDRAWWRDYKKRQMKKEEYIYEEAFSVKDFDDLKKGDTITVEFKSSISSNNKRTLKVTAKNIVGANKIPKVTLKDAEKPKGIKYFLYKRGNTVSFAQGDMAASIVNYTINEEVELDEALPPHLQKHFDKDGDKVEGKWINGKFVANKVQPKSKFKSIIRDVTPKGYGPTEDVELDENKRKNINAKFSPSEHEAVRKALHAAVNHWDGKETPAYMTSLKRMKNRDKSWTFNTDEVQFMYDAIADLPQHAKTATMLKRKLSMAEEVGLDEKCWPGYKQVGMKKKGDKVVPNCVKEEKITKGLSKINKLMEKRSMLKGGAGEEGTDDLVKKYKEDTPGQTVTEGNIVYDNNDPFRIFEKLVHYLMGSSVKKISDLTYEMVENANNQVKITDVKGPIGLINEVDVKNFFGQNFTIEDFIDMIEEFGVRMQKQNIVVAYTPTEETVEDNMSEDIQRYYNVIKNDAIIGKQGFLIKKD